MQQESEKLAITRITKSCVLLEFGEEAVLTDPWFTERWHLHRSEPLGMTVEEFPALSAIVASHFFIDHWDMPAFSAYPHKDTTPVYVSTEKMARQARDVGFARVAQLDWGDTLQMSDGLELEVVRARRMLGIQTNNYVISGGGARVFFGGEARDLEPLQEYRRAHPPVDVILVPVNGLGPLLGPKIVMASREAIEATRILGGNTLVPIHDALGRDPWLAVLRRRGSTEETVRLAAAMADAPKVRALSPGERWVWTDRSRQQIHTRASRT